MSRHIHMAGIVPIIILMILRYRYPWCMLPVDQGFTIQKSVFECAIAGCQTLIVANDDLAPITEKQLVIGHTIQFIIIEKKNTIKTNAKKYQSIMFPYIPKIVIVVILTAGQLFGMHSAWYVSADCQNG